MIRAAQHKEKIEGPVNLAGGEEIQICKLVRKIAELTQTRSKIEIGALPYRPNEIWRMYGDSTRARDILGWKHAINVEQGLKLTVDWFHDQLAKGNPVII
jgi:nucleoside-diphosphate-sugar epimerase